MNRRSTIIACALAVSAQIGCARQTGISSGRNADPYREFPADRFLVGAATGATRDAAIDQAIARIAQQIEVRVVATEQRRSLYDAASALAATDSTSLESSVHLVTSATLLGVEIIETRPLDSGASSALAALDINRSLALYDTAIHRHDESIRTLVQRADDATSDWRRYIDTARALRLAVERDTFAVTRGVLESRAGRTAQAITLTAPGLVDRFETLRDSISLSVVPNGDCPEALATRAGAALSGLGLPLEHDVPGVIQLRVGWRPDAARTYDPRRWSCRWRLSVSLYDTQRGATIARSDAPSGSAYGPSREAAIEEALAQAVVAIDDAVESVILDSGTTTATEPAPSRP
ncbi:MAG: LPP20 family lipoprotein [Phycisphaeraceae bacterium]|nr:LPP20 family lipoprotein [Phycisphaeraceae bacterium]